MERLKKINFWKRLETFVSNVQVSDCPSEEEKQMILSICEEYANKPITPMPDAQAQNIIVLAKRFIDDTDGVFLGALGAQSRRDLMDSINKI